MKTFQVKSIFRFFVRRSCHIWLISSFARYPVTRHVRVVAIVMSESVMSEKMFHRFTEWVTPFPFFSFRQLFWGPMCRSYLGTLTKSQKQKDRIVMGKGLKIMVPILCIGYGEDSQWTTQLLLVFSLFTFYYHLLFRGYR